MIIFKTVSQMMAFKEKENASNKTFGFVPTMGALHEGHISLIRASISQNDLTVCSIFVNPTQFNNPVDFEKYPITIEADINMLEGNGCDILFLPSVDEMYSAEIKFPFYELGYLDNLLEAAFRPGHYQGVCKIVDRLLTVVKPTILYLGQKDYQQCMVIKKMMELRNIHTVIHIEKTIRETDGLAMSSRNARLNAEERKTAVKIFDALSCIQHELKPGPLDAIKQKATLFLIENGYRVDYVEIADASNLAPLHEWDGEISLVILIAAYLNEVRLIDNFVLLPSRTK
ncbi:MAG: pantoate--beta-alanine ligase [Ferruginibacter sp.]